MYIIFFKKTMPLFQILESSRELWIITKACMVKFTWVNHVDESSVDLSENIVSCTGRGIEFNCIESSFISNADNVFSMLCHVVLVLYQYILEQCLLKSRYYSTIVESLQTKDKKTCDPLKAQLKNKDRFFIAKGFYSIKGRRVICIIRCRNCIKITCGSRFITGA